MMAFLALPPPAETTPADPNRVERPFVWDFYVAPDDAEAARIEYRRKREAARQRLHSAWWPWTEAAILRQYPELRRSWWDPINLPPHFDDLGQPLPPPPPPRVAKVKPRSMSAKAAKAYGYF